jgi:hypothetical protein
MADPNYAAFLPDPMQAMTAGSNYVNQLYAQAKKAEDDRAMQQAGQQYATGDYNAASSTLAQSGNIPAAQQVQTAGQTANSAGMQALIRAYPVFEGIAQKTAAYGPQAQSQALRHALALYRQELQQTTGISNRVLDSVDASFASDPQGTLDRFKAMMPTEFKPVGDTLYGIQGNNVVSQNTGDKYMTVNGKIVHVGGSSGTPSPQMPSGAATPEQPPAQSGTDLFGGMADPNAVASIESKGNPNAVSPAGAIGTMQTMPGTLRDPGFGVTPAQDNSAHEQTRVGQDYLHALGNQYGNPVDQLVAYNWGPGNAQRWIQQGRHWDQLPRETQLYLGRAVVAQMAGRQPPPLPSAAQQASYAGAGASIPAFPQGSPGAQLANQLSPQQGPQQQGGAQVVYDGGPEVTPISQASPSARSAYPGAVAIKADGTPIYPPANASTVADSSLGTPDAQSNSILAATGLPYEAFLTLTGQATKLPRDKTTRSVAFKTATDFANKRGVDVSTFASQYDAYNEVLQNNIKRYNQTRIMEGELQGTISNLKPVADAVGMGRLRIGNVLEAAAGKEVNDPTVMQYAFQLQQLRAELAGYNGALQGRSGNGITEQDMREADQVIKNGLSSGGAAGLDKAVAAATQKMSGVLQTSIRLTNRAVWDLFGIGKQFDRLHPAPKPQMAQRPQGGGSKIIRYDAQGNRIE